MALPSRADLLLLDRSFLGMPFCDVEAKSLNTKLLDFTFLGMPFVVAAVESGAPPSSVELTSISFSTQAQALSFTSSLSLLQASISLLATNQSQQLAASLTDAQISIVSREMQAALLQSYLNVAFSLSGTSLDWSMPNLVELLAANISCSTTEVSQKLSNAFASVGVNFSAQDIDYLFVNERELLSASFSLQATSLYLPFVITLNDLVLNQVIKGKLYSLGYRGSLQDSLLEFFKDEGAVSSNLRDCEREWLFIKTGVDTINVEDCWEKFLVGLGYDGSINEMLKKYWYDV